MLAFLVLELAMMESQPRKRKRYNVCPHCNKELNIKRYKEHKRLYFNEVTKQWMVEDQAKSLGDDSSSDCFSSLDECDAGDLSSFANQQEGQNSDSFDLDDLGDLTEYQTEHLADDTVPPKSPPQDQLEYWIENDEDIENDLDTFTLPPQDIPLETPETSDKQSTIIVRWIVFLVSFFQSKFSITDRAISWLLQFLYILLKVLGTFSSKIYSVANALPRSLYRHDQQLCNLSVSHSDSFQKRVACRRCWELYTLDEAKLLKDCPYKPLPRSRRCGEPLIKSIVSKNGQRKVYPNLVFCYSSLKASLQSLVLRPGFVEKCESTRKLISSSGLSDVYDGNIWKEFQSVDGHDFLSSPNNYGLLLNIDWFKPFEHSTYSVGVIFLVVLNLPRSIRFRRENVILYGIMPGPSEPTLTVNSYLKPLVSGLLDLWNGVLLTVPGSNSKTTFRCALLGVSCDLPAGRKTCGLTSYSANLGCSRCYYNFFPGNGKADYGGNFERSLWRLRSNEQHRADVRKTLLCSTVTGRSTTELQLGCRYSVLLDLPYFDPIRMLLIDPMHNLYMGTAKHITFDILIGKNNFKKEAFDKIKNRLSNTVVPSGLGRLPSSLSPGTFLTAEQWQNWTLYFSIYCLHGLIPQVQLECWRHFVLACRKLSEFTVSENNLAIADTALVCFCKKVKQLFGSEALTPNIHMHCHLISCIRDFGPMRAFWLFPFERFNGILGSQPTNNRSIEIQLMNRFYKDNVHMQLATEARHWPLSDEFLDLIADTTDSPTSTSSSVTSFGFSADIELGVKYTISCLSSDLLAVLRKLYSILYPEYSEELLDGRISLSSTYKRHTYIVKHGKRVNSSKPGAKDVYIFATPLFPFTTSRHSEFEGCHRPAQIHYFLQHSLVLPNSEEPKSHILAQVTWPMVHPQRFLFGKPVEVWCNDLNEPVVDNTFLPVGAIANRIIYSIDELEATHERVLIIIPLVD